MSDPNERVTLFKDHIIAIVDNWTKACAELDAAREQVKLLRGVVKPFAALMDWRDRTYGKDYNDHGATMVKLQFLRAARCAYEATEPKE